MLLFESIPYGICSTLLEMPHCPDYRRLSSVSIHNYLRQANLRGNELHTNIECLAGTHVRPRWHTLKSPKSCEKGLKVKSQNAVVLVLYDILLLDEMSRLSQNPSMAFIIAQRNWL